MRRRATGGASGGRGLCGLASPLSLGLTLTICALAPPARAEAAGMITHAWMADAAIERVDDPALKALLTTHRHEVLSGASYPDGGYFAQRVNPAYNYGEISHWERFVNGYIAYLRGREGCEDLTDPLGPCAPLVAHMLGTGAHGLGDEMWDWMFEPLVTDHGEVPEHPLAPPELNGVIGNIEYAMDTIALADHFRWGDSGYYLPPPSELTPVYDAIGYGHIDEDAILAGHAGGSAALSAERLGGAADAPRVREQMPWSSAHMHDESGGVFDTADGVAGYYEALWSKLIDAEPPRPKLISVHPERGETGVPFRFHPAKTSPGPHTGGGELRIIAVLSNAIDPATVTPQSFQLLGPRGRAVTTARGEVIPHHERERLAAGEPVPPLDGFPRLGPYGPADGTHSMMIYPATDLEPCTTYTAVLSPTIADWDELPVNEGRTLGSEQRWSFTTRSTTGAPCPASPPRCRGLAATVYPEISTGAMLRGTAGDDVIVGNPRQETIRARAGDDVICARGGADRVGAGRGDDHVFGGGGDDELRGGAGSDRVRGNSGRDQLRGGRRPDRLLGGSGADTVFGAGGPDRLDGRRGPDRLIGGPGNDAAHGGPGRDRCQGGAGRDRAVSCEHRFGIP